MREPEGAEEHDHSLIAPGFVGVLRDFRRSLRGPEGRYGDPAAGQSAAADSPRLHEGGLAPATFWVPKRCRGSRATQSGASPQKSKGRRGGAK